MVLAASNIKTGLLGTSMASASSEVEIVVHRIGAALLDPLQGLPHQPAHGRQVHMSRSTSGPSLGTAWPAPLRLAG